MSIGRDADDLDFRTHFRGQETAVKQSDKDRCCVNKIMVKYRKTGVIDHLRPSQGRYGDFTNAGDFRMAMNIVARGKEAFEALPSAVRKRFNNDPAGFLNFVHDDKNHDELVKMGLANPAPIEPVQGDADSSATTPAEESPKRSSVKSSAKAPPSTE